MSRISEKITFDNGRGDALAALLERPAGAARAYAVMGPCFTCPKESHGSMKISRALAERGIAALRIDTTGFGASEGDPLATNITSRIADLAAAASYMTDAGMAPRLMIGHSKSGTAALSAWRHCPSVDTLVTIGAPRDSQRTIERFTKDGLIGPDPADAARIVIDVLGRPVPFYKSFIDDMMAGTGAADTAAFTGTLLAAHARTDTIVGYDEAEAIVARAVNARHAEVFTLPDSAGHLFLKGSADAEILADKIASLL
jgi:putative redox protein